MEAYDEYRIVPGEATTSWYSNTSHQRKEERAKRVRTHRDESVPKVLKLTKLDSQKWESYQVQYKHYFG